MHNAPLREPSRSGGAPAYGEDRGQVEPGSASVCAIASSASSKPGERKEVFFFEKKNQKTFTHSGQH
jgi:hypothetical protein